MNWKIKFIKLFIVSATNDTRLEKWIVCRVYIYFIRRFTCDSQYLCCYKICVVIVHRENRLFYWAYIFLWWILRKIVFLAFKAVDFELRQIQPFISASLSFQAFEVNCKRLKQTPLFNKKENFKKFTNQDLY